MTSKPHPSISPSLLVPMVSFNSPPMGSSDYMILRPEKAGLLDILHLLIFKPKLSDCKFVDMSLSHDIKLSDTPSYIVALSLFIQKLFYLIEYPLRLFGYAVEFPFNLVTTNGGVFSLIQKLMTGRCKDSEDQCISSNFLMLQSVDCHAFSFHCQGKFFFFFFKYGIVGVGKSHIA